jgi:hypothetical protein
MTGLTVLDFDAGGPGFGRIYLADGAAKCKQRIHVLGSADSVTTGETVALLYPRLLLRPASVAGGFGGLQI